MTKKTWVTDKVRNERLSQPRLSDGCADNIESLAEGVGSAEKQVAGG